MVSWAATFHFMIYKYPIYNTTKTKFHYMDSSFIKHKTHEIEHVVYTP